MKKSVLLIIMTGLFLACELMAQAPGDTLWTKTYGGADWDCGQSVQQTTDNGYIIVGFTGLMDIFNDVYLVKTDVNGDTLWTKTYGGGGVVDNDYGSSVFQTTDGGYVIAGYTNSFGAGAFDVYLIKTDLSGDTLWTKTYGGAGTDCGEAGYQTTDGGYIIAGYTSSYGAGGNDVYLIKTDSDGDTLWTKTFGGAGTDCGKSVFQTTDGGYVITGYTNSYGAGETDVYLIKTDSDGDTLWTKTYGGTGGDGGRSVQQTNDNGYIIVGYTYTGGYGGDVYLIKTDVNGDTLWTKTYGGGSDDLGSAVQQTTDNGYVIVGYTASYGAGGDVWFLRTDVNGDTLWTKTYGGGNNDVGCSVQLTSDGGYIIAGQTQSFGAGGSDVWLLKLEGDGLPLNSPQNLFVTEEAYASWEAPSSKDLLGYNLYLDGDFVGYTTDLLYQYEDLINEQTYVAGVSAVYDEGESAIVEYEFTYLYVGVENNITPVTELLGNFPNPFNSSTTISFSVEGSDKNTMITIYNFNGQIIKTLVNKKINAGKHQVIWDGTDDSGNQVSSGIYFYKMKHGDKYTGFKKMIFMK